ncbi:MAG: (2Fe-2S)-binding protein [Pseudomonadales bacterium]|nr:(2Fe-2S)-binding protein [Pseudomonadales bacterium]
MYVCICKGITDGQLRQAVDNGASSFREIAQTTGCSTQCGQCACTAKSLVESAIAEVQGANLYHAA